jgi:hypothetical protein
MAEIGPVGCSNISCKSFKVPKVTGGNPLVFCRSDIAAGRQLERETEREREESCGQGLPVVRIVHFIWSSFQETYPASARHNPNHRKEKSNKTCIYRMATPASAADRVTD